MRACRGERVARYIAADDDERIDSGITRDGMPRCERSWNGARAARAFDIPLVMISAAWADDGDKRPPRSPISPRSARISQKMRAEAA